MPTYNNLNWRKSLKDHMNDWENEGMEVEDNCKPHWEKKVEMPKYNNLIWKKKCLKDQINYFVNEGKEVEDNSKQQLKMIKSINVKILYF